MKIDMEDTLTRFAGFNKSNDLIYLIDSRGRNTAALYALDLNTKERASWQKTQIGPNRNDVIPQRRMCRRWHSTMTG